MHSSNRSTVRAGIAAACLGLLAACAGTAVRDGEVPPFPDPARATFDEGSYPNTDNLRAIGAGMTKDQLYGLIGRPHYDEGVFRVRQWDYLFNFRDADGNVGACQYKVLFDERERVRSTHWNPRSCSGFVYPEEPQPAQVVQGPVEERRVTLSTDVLFGFASAELTPSGRQVLDNVAAQFRVDDVERIEVTGHTDRIGAEADNERLSASRAEAVQDYFRGKGVDGAIIAAQGRGEREPLVECAQTRQQELVACLAPNRRVEVLIRLSQR